MILTILILSCRADILLLAELDQFDHALNYELEQLAEKDKQISQYYPYSTKS